MCFWEVYKYRNMVNSEVKMKVRMLDGSEYEVNQGRFGTHLTVGSSHQEDIVVPEEYAEEVALPQVTFTSRRGRKMIVNHGQHYTFNNAPAFSGDRPKLIELKVRDRIRFGKRLEITVIE